MIVSSGVIWSSEVKEGLMKFGSFICYDSLGSSEGVGFAGSVTAPGAEHKTAKFTIGTSTKVFKDDGAEVVPGSGEIGRLAVGGNIPLGYYKDERSRDATFLVINGERWSVPGDFASVEADGSITLLGRGSVVINSGGEKIFPEEVEEAVKLHPAVLDCLVVGVPDDRFGEAVTAVCSLHGDLQATPDEIAARSKALRATSARGASSSSTRSYAARTARPTTSGQSKPPSPEELGGSRKFRRRSSLLLLAARRQPWRARRAS